MQSGYLVAIEGVDGVGKTTLAQGLAKRRGALYYKTPGLVSSVVRAVFDQPGVPVVDRFRFYLNCCKDDIEAIVGMVSDGEEVICDRFLASTITHHKNMDPNLDVSEALKLDDTVDRVQILLTATQDELQRRLSQRSHLTRFEKDADLFMSTQNEFLRLKNDLVIDTCEYNAEAALRVADDYLTNIMDYEYGTRDKVSARG